MRYEIDQSGKIEKTNKDTILCLSNDFWDAILIKARVKRQIQEIFRRNGQIRNFILFTFSVGLAILIKRNLRVGKMTVDREYFGKEGAVKRIAHEILKDEKQWPEIVFASIGKNARAHHFAHKIAVGKLRPKKTADFNELFKAIKMTEVGKRLKNA